MRADENLYGPLRLWRHREAEARFIRRAATLAAFLLGLIVLCGCAEVSHDVQSLLFRRFQRSEIVGFVAGLGTTFAAVPDLVAMLRRRGTPGMRPRMAAIMGTFQVVWVYYGLLIGSLPVVAWNVIAVFINFLNVIIYAHLNRKESQRYQ